MPQADNVIEGEPIPLDEEHEAKVMAAMNQWVPKLDQSEYVSKILHTL